MHGFIALTEMLELFCPLNQLSQFPELLDASIAGNFTKAQRWDP